MGLYLCICTYICKYVAGGAYMPLAGTSRVQGIKVGFKGVKEEPYWKVLIVTDRHTDTQTFTGVRVKCYKQTGRLFQEVRIKWPCMSTLPMCCCCCCRYQLNTLRLVYLLCLITTVHQTLAKAPLHLHQCKSQHSLPPKASCMPLLWHGVSFPTRRAL